MSTELTIQLSSHYRYHHSTMRLLSIGWVKNVVDALNVFRAPGLEWIGSRFSATVRLNFVHYLTWHFSGCRWERSRFASPLLFQFRYFGWDSDNGMRRRRREKSIISFSQCLPHFSIPLLLTSNSILLLWLVYTWFFCVYVKLIFVLFFDYLLFLPARDGFFDFFFDLACSDVDSLSAELFLHVWVVVVVRIVIEFSAYMCIHFGDSRESRNRWDVIWEREEKRAKKEWKI